MLEEIIYTTMIEEIINIPMLEEIIYTSIIEEIINIPMLENTLMLEEFINKNMIYDEIEFNCL
jgi:hypothetical protein